MLLFFSLYADFCTKLPIFGNLHLFSSTIILWNLTILCGSTISLNSPHFIHICGKWAKIAHFGTIWSMNERGKIVKFYDNLKLLKTPHLFHICENLTKIAQNGTFVIILCRHICDIFVRIYGNVNLPYFMKMLIIYSIYAKSVRKWHENGHKTVENVYQLVAPIIKAA